MPTGNNRITLDNPIIKSRVRGYSSSKTSWVKTSTAQKSTLPNNTDINNVRSPAVKTTSTLINEITVQNRVIDKRKLQGFALSVVAIMFIGLGIVLGLHGFNTNKQAEAQVKAISVNDEGDRPTNTNDYDETPVSSILNYQVAPDMPKYIKIPSINVFARIKRVSVDSSNTIQVPKGIFDAGWYEGSAKLGEPGAVFIDGHVSGPTTNGIFYNLKKLKKGDLIEVERGDGKKFQYKVFAVEKYAADNVDMKKVLKPYHNNVRGLNLMTCTGRFLPKEQSFDGRIVVYTFLQ